MSRPLDASHLRTETGCGLFGCFTHTQTTWDTDVIESLVDATMWMHRKSGVLLGAGTGISRVSVGDGETDWTASGPVFDVFLGAQRTHKNELMVFLRVGYTHRDFGTVDGRHGVSGQVTPLALDFSSVYVEIGFGGNTRRGWGSSR